MIRVENLHFKFPKTYLGEISIEMQDYQKFLHGEIEVITPNVILFQDPRDVVAFSEHFWGRDYQIQQTEE